MITKEDVKRGYENGAVSFCKDHWNDDVVCQIGFGICSNWFYFGGEDAEDTTPTQFLDEVGVDNALEWVTNALNDSIKEIDEDEYAFYEAVLAKYR